jgi:hypothetical protein
MVEGFGLPVGPSASGEPGRVLRVPLRPGEAPCELLAALVGYLQRRFDLDVVDYDLTGESSGVVRLSLPDPAERLRRLTTRSLQARAHTTQLAERNQSLRARGRVLSAERAMWMDVIHANRHLSQLNLARCHLSLTGSQELPG